LLIFYHFHECRSQERQNGLDKANLYEVFCYHLAYLDLTVKSADLNATLGGISERIGKLGMALAVGLKMSDGRHLNDEKDV
jgi:hypothetical protein